MGLEIVKSNSFHSCFLRPGIITYYIHERRTRIGFLLPMKESWEMSMLAMVGGFMS